MPNQNEKIGLEINEEKYKELSHKFFDIWEDKDVEIKARFKKPSPVIIKRMQAVASKDANKAAYNLLIDCCHADDLSNLKENLETYPAVSATISSAILKACGVSSELGN